MLITHLKENRQCKSCISHWQMACSVYMYEGFIYYCMKIVTGICFRKKILYTNVRGVWGGGGSGTHSRLIYITSVE